MFRLSLLYFGIIVIGVFGINAQEYCDEDEETCYNEEESRYNEEESRYNEEESRVEYDLDDEFDYFSKIKLFGLLINTSIDPCINFYKYTCNNWDNDILRVYKLQSIKHYNQYKIYYRARELLEEENEYDELPFIKMAKQHYQSCINEDALEKRGLEPMQRMLDATGGWPILMSEEEWNAKNYTWQKMDNDYFKLYTFSILFDISYQTDYENAGILMIRPFPHYPLGNKLKIDIQQSPYNIRTIMQLLLDKTKGWPKYIKTIMEVVQAFAKDKGINIPKQKLFTDVTELIEFETNLENIIEYKKKILEKSTATGDKMTIARLQEYYDLARAQEATAKINWLDKIQTAFKLLNKTIDASESVLVFNKEILHQLARLLHVTPQHVIVNYLQWHVVRIFMGNLNKEMKNIELEHHHSHDIYSPNRKIYIEIKQKRRWLKCIEQFEMKDALSYLYVKTYISAYNMQAVLDIFDDVKEEMITYIKYSMWQNTLTNFMIQRIYNMSLRIDYPEWYDNPTALAEMYKGLEIDDNYFTNVLAIIKYKNIIKQRGFHESMHREERLHRWLLDLLSDNPNYDQQSNVINIPAAIMQYPYFSPNGPLAGNYGAIGSIIGQLLYHSVNMYIESYFAYEDNLKLKIRNRQTFEKGSICSIKRYRNFLLNVINGNPEYIQLYENLVKDEIVAHFIGIQVASAAFQKRMSNSPELISDFRSYKIASEDTNSQSKLPITHFTQKQLFFLFNTLLLCGMHNPYDEDLIDIFRVKEQISDNLANIGAFSKAFNCPFNCYNIWQSKES